MNNPLEQLLRKQKKADLQKKVGYVGPMVGDVPREFGEGDHFVQLAYITPDEAAILKELDLYGSNPPHTGPEIENIPNYNDFGEGSMNASGSQMSAAERGDVKGSGLSASDVAGIQAGFDAAAGGQQTSQDFMDSNQNTNTTSTTPVQDTVATAQELNVAPEVKQESFFDKIFSGLFTKKTAKQNFVDKVSQNPRLSKFVKDTYGIKSLDDITEAQVNEINDLNNLSFDEIQDYVSKITGQAIDDPLGTGYNALTGATLGFQGIGTLGMMNTLANIAMDKPSFAMNPKNYAFTGPMVDAEGNLVSQDFSYTGPMSTNPAVNQQIADIQSISGVTGLTESQMAQAAAQAMTEAETGGKFSMGGGNKDDGVLNQQNTEQQTIQNYMDGLTQSELDRYNQLIAQGYNDEYARAYLGML